jgi:hypothetical protein
LRIGSRAAIVAIRTVEPFWVAGAVLWVYLSYLLQMGASLGWAGLAMGSLPLVIRLVSQGYKGVRTPFDLAIVLIIAGGLVGLLVSPVFELSLGAFQSLLAMTLFYYSIANYPRPVSVVKWGLLILFLSLIVATFFAISRGYYAPASINWLSSWFFEVTEYAPKLPEVAGQPNLTIGMNHGLALGFLIVAAISVGFAAFGRRIRVRAVAALLSILFVAVTVVFSYSSIVRLFTWENMDGRVLLWGDTIQMLKGHTLSGLGLGSWAPLYNGGILVENPTHPHNAYLELYANAGVLGALAFIVCLIVTVRLSWDMLRSSRIGPWYGLGVGVVLSFLIAALVGLVESAPVGIPLVGTNAYFYVVSPLPWLMLSFMVVAHRLRTRVDAEENAV